MYARDSEIDFDVEDKGPDYWYINRHLLDPGMVFMTDVGSKVMLDRSVPGDGTKWYVADWHNGSWSYMDATIEPGELIGNPLKQ